MKGQLGFFDLEDRYAQLSKAGDPLEKLASVVDFEPFRYRLVKALKRSDGEGRPPALRSDVRHAHLAFGASLFKILILQALYGMSDDQAEFQIRDRLTFIRFLGLGPGDAVPDAKTIWLFREQLTRAGAIEKLFARFDTLLRDKGYLAMSGQILDASLIPAPRQHLDDGEKEAIKEGKSTAEMSCAKGHRRPLDLDVAIPVFGYKNHIGIWRYGLPHLAGERCRRP